MTTSTSSTAPASTSTSSGEVLVKAEHVSKIFCRDLKKSLFYGVQDIAGEFIGRQRVPDLMQPPVEDGSDLRSKEFWAVRDVNFELRRGECLGLIGHNGAGKTTLLKMLNGLIRPDRGRITMKGRVGALIALGAGFNPILTGRENIYVNGSVLGLSKKEIDAKFDDIVEFSGIPDFIDTPVQSYSSGMQVRLGFAVATALEPDILLLDEVLAVGDAAFRSKCYQRIIEKLRTSAVIFVSHSVAQVAQVSQTGLFMEQGAAQYYPDVRQAIERYEMIQENSKDGGENFIKVMPPATQVDLELTSKRIKLDEDLRFHVDIHTTDRVAECYFKVLIYNSANQLVAESNGSDAGKVFDLSPGRSQIEVVIPSLQLRQGKYSLGILLHYGKTIEHLFWDFKTKQFSVVGNFSGSSNLQLGQTICLNS